MGAEALVQYLGGKTRIAKDLATVINHIRGDRPVWDAFCGGLSVSAALGGKVLATDNNQALISTYQAVQRGWIPPDHVSEDEYHAAKTLPDTDPLKAFIGIGCSFGGKWFGGYARDPKNGRNFCRTAKNLLFEKMQNARNWEIHCLDFCSVEARPVEIVLYLDPPYRGTTGYRHKFDHDRFYQRVQEWSKYTDVFVSEYAMPFGVCVWERSVGNSLIIQTKASDGTRVERLYHCRDIR